MKIKKRYNIIKKFLQILLFSYLKIRKFYFNYWSDFKTRVFNFEKSFKQINIQAQ